MKLAVFCLHDKKGYVHDYVIEYLKALTTVVDAIDVIVNGFIDDDGHKKICRLVRNIYFRENKGFDGGAYAEYFIKWRDKEELRKCERLVLLNDTVFGPLVPMTEIFLSMEDKEKDYWGIIEQSRGAFSYLSSFFLVYENSILNDESLQKYFEENAELLMRGVYIDILSFFERGIHYYLKQRGYKYASYCHIPYYDIFYSSDRCVLKEGFPFLKRKCLNTYMYGKLQLDMIMNYIEKNTKYDPGLIKNYIKSVYGYIYKVSEYSEEDAEEKLDHVVNLPQFDASEEEIIEFLKANEEVYIYGAGYHARTIYKIFRPYMKEFKGFAVTKKGTKDHFLGNEVIEAKDLPRTAATLVALDRGNTAQVREMLASMGKNAYYLWR